MFRIGTRKIGSMAVGGTSLALFGLWSTRSKELDQELKKGRWTWRTGAFCLSKDDPVSSSDMASIETRARKLDGKCCGEDSFVIAENKEQSVIAIADGVGGWRRRGIDPAKFSRCLMSQISQLVKSKVRLDSDELLRKAFYGLVNTYLRGDGEPPFGSSTACIASLRRQGGLLDVTNLGDSGVIVVREGAIVYKSQTQQTRFNAPYQATLRPNGDIDDMTPMASTEAFPVESGDLVVMATDGLWDNVWEGDLMDALSKHDFKDLARNLVLMARDAAASEKDSPFAVESKKNGKAYEGGKPDDITVIVALIECTQ